MNWFPLTTIEQIKDIITESATTPVLIFKHSTRCSISVTALSRTERHWSFTSEQVIPYYLDLLSYREVSNAVAAQFSVHHESPQVLLIKNGECVYEETHLNILVAEIAEQL